MKPIAKDNDFIFNCISTLFELMNQHLLGLVFHDGQLGNNFLIFHFKLYKQTKILMYYLILDVLYKKLKVNIIIYNTSNLLLDNMVKFN